MQKKGAIELSVNMLVVIILSIVILVGGIAFLYKMIGDAGTIKDQLDSRTELEIQRLLIDQGKPVALPYYSKSVGREQSAVYGIGIRNTFSESKEFQLSVTFDKAVSSSNEVLDLELNPLDWLLFDSEPLLLDSGQFDIVSIHASVPAEADSAQYLFKARVSVEGEPHGNVQQFVVIVS